MDDDDDVDNDSNNNNKQIKKESNAGQINKMKKVEEDATKEVKKKS